MKRKILSALSVILILLLFAGCSGNKSLTLIDREEKVKIGLVAYDETAEYKDAKLGFEEGIKELGLNGEVEIDYQNAKGDAKLLNEICADIFKNNDLVVTIGEEASVVADMQREDISKPIFFVGVKNPVTARLMSNTITPSKNITGIMSNVTPDCIFSFASEKIGGQIKKVGIIYNTSQINPAYEINELKDYLNSNSIKYFEGVIANGFDAQQAALEIVGTKIPSEDGDGKMINPRTVFVISSDDISKKSIESISPIVKNVNAIAFVLGQTELPNENFFSIVPVYKSMGNKCVTMINEYIHGVEMLALSATSSDEYNLYQGEPSDDEEESTIGLEEAAETEDEELTEE